MSASNLHPGTPVARTTLRPPHRVVEMLDCHAHHNRMSRSEAIRDALDRYLTGSPLAGAGLSDRLYRQLNSRLVATPIGLSCPAGRLAQYRRHADQLGHRSLCGLLAVAVLTVHRGCP